MTGTGLTWFKSSYSGGDGDSCVEVAPCPTAIHVRDSKDTTLPSFHVAPAAWRAFVSAIPPQPVRAKVRSTTHR
ncbi:DUF397 domain-containing protein [Streptomyces sp. KLOTTS4A1]|uniref:DUF397 domain-containing protein n=1 Tax=Streptomyces sp. KLOTTS4A1 TaxID=3390996 RepID=UPI0039F49CDE